MGVCFLSVRVSPLGKIRRGRADQGVEVLVAVRRRFKDPRPRANWLGRYYVQDFAANLCSLYPSHNIYVTLTEIEEAVLSTAYEQYRAERLADPEFRALYEQKRVEIDLIDTILSHIESRREELGLSKADLARLVGARPESVRRLLSARPSNPTLFTVTRLASVLGMQIDVKTTVSAKKLGPKVRKAAKELTAAAA